MNRELDRRRPSFLWMSYEATSNGLCLDPQALDNVEWKWPDLGEMKESLKGMWRLLETLPLKRHSSQDPDKYTRR